MAEKLGRSPARSTAQLSVRLKAGRRTKAAPSGAGRERPGTIAGSWTLSAQVYVSSDFNTTTGPLVRAALWGHSGPTPEGGAYMLLGLTHASPTDPLNPAALDRSFRFRVFDVNFGDFIDLGVPGGFAFDDWHTLSGTATGTSFEYRIDGMIVQTLATEDGADLLSAMVQGYNFGEAAGYSVYWDNVTATAIPEPAVGSLAVALGVLGLAGWRRRFRRRT